MNDFIRYAAVFRITALVAALLVLNFVLSFHNIWPTPWITMRPEISVEIAALVLVLALYTEWRGQPSRAVMLALAGVVTLFALARYFEVTAPALYGRGVNLYWDLRQIPAIGGMLIDSVPGWLVIFGALGVAGLLILIFVLVRLSLRAVNHTFGSTMPRRVTACVMTLVVAGYAGGHAGVLPQSILRAYSLPLTMTYKRQLEFVVDAMTAPAIPAGNASLASDYDLGALRGADVLFTFIESYGAVVFDEPGIETATRDGREALAAALDATGRTAVSGMVRSPTFGGVSWLAHASFLTGLEVTRNRQYNLLLTRERNTVPAIFRRSGYRTVAVMPGMRGAWPEGQAFYGYDRIYGEQALDYRGPDFGWWRIPDQFALARLQELELDGDREVPVAAFVETISTHLPFRPLPPLQEDRARLLSPEPFAADAVEARLAERPAWTDLRPSYIDAINYSYGYWREFFREQGQRPLVTVLMGDHQPAASITGEGARWDVPVHVIVDNPAITRRLLDAGFTPGLVPRRDSLGPMHELVDTLLRAFSAATGTAEGADQGQGQGTGGRYGEQREQDRP